MFENYPLGDPLTYTQSLHKAHVMSLATRVQLEPNLVVIKASLLICNI
jgi:hypothetical protein